MSNRQRIRPVRDNDVTVPRVEPALITSCLRLASDTGPGGWQKRGWLIEATAALVAVKKVSFEDARAALTRTIALLTYYNRGAGSLREAGHTWGGRTSTAFSEGLLEAAAVARCGANGLNDGDMVRLLATGTTLPPAITPVTK